MKIIIRNFLTSLALAFSLVLAAPLAAAEKAPVYTSVFSDTAVQGYDVVAYFEEGKAVKGDSDFTTTYKGADFMFKDAANLAKFQANPGEFAPQYGGYCAWAVSQGYTAKGNAKNWKIVDGKLYLNYNSKVQKDWEADIPGFIGAANTNWPKVLK